MAAPRLEVERGCARVQEQRAGGATVSENFGDPLYNDARKPFDAWAAYVILEHAGDGKAAEAAFREAHPEQALTPEQLQAKDRGEQIAVVDEDGALETDPFALDQYIIDLGDIGTAPEVIPFTVERLLPEGMTSGLAGPGKVGKSQAALALGVSVALGRPWHGLATMPGPVIYLSAEDHKTVLKNRLKAMLAFDRKLAEERIERQKFNDNTLTPMSEVYRTIRERMVIADLYGSGFSLTSNDKGRTSVNEADVGRLVEWMDRLFPGERPLLIFDTIGRYDEGAESNADYKLLVRALDMVQKASGCTQLILAHTSQQATLEKRMDLTALRGGLHLGNSVRSLMILAGHKLGVRDEALESQGVIPPKASDLEGEAVHRSMRLLDGMDKLDPAGVGDWIGSRLSVLVHSDSNVGPTLGPRWFVRGGYHQAGILVPFEFTPDLAGRKQEREERRSEEKEQAQARREQKDYEAVLEYVGGGRTTRGVPDQAVPEKPAEGRPEGRHQQSAGRGGAGTTGDRKPAGSRGQGGQAGETQRAAEGLPAAEGGRLTGSRLPRTPYAGRLPVSQDSLPVTARGTAWLRLGGAHASATRQPRLATNWRPSAGSRSPVGS